MILEKDFFKYGSAILRDPQMRSSQRNTQHGNISVFTHSVMVAKYSCLLDRYFDLNCSKSALIRGALLHDFFLYDWHNIPKEIAKEGLHGFKHPVIAARNARAHFNVTPKEYGIIITHMWPLTFTRVPFTRECWVICAVDKYCSILETLGIQPYSNQSVKAWISKGAKKYKELFSQSSLSKITSDIPISSSSPDYQKRYKSFNDFIQKTVNEAS